MFWTKSLHRPWKQAFAPSKSTTISGDSTVAHRSQRVFLLLPTPYSQSDFWLFAHFLSSIQVKAFRFPPEKSLGSPRYSTSTNQDALPQSSFQENHPRNAPS